MISLWNFLLFALNNIFFFVEYIQLDKKWEKKGNEQQQNIKKNKEWMEGTYWANPFLRFSEKKKKMREENSIEVQSAYILNLQKESWINSSLKKFFFSSTFSSNERSEFQENFCFDKESLDTPQCCVNKNYLFFSILNGFLFSSVFFSMDSSLPDVNIISLQFILIVALKPKN